MKNDDYGFCNELGSDAVKVLDSAGMAAFEQAVRTRFEASCGKQEQNTGNYVRDQSKQSSRAKEHVWNRPFSIGRARSGHQG